MMNNRPNKPYIKPIRGRINNHHRSRPYNRNRTSNPIQHHRGRLLHTTHQTPNNDGQPSTVRGSAEKIVDERLNFSSINKIKVDSWRASFNVVFARSRKPAVVTFERAQSGRIWQHFNQEGFFAGFQIRDEISNSTASSRYSCTLPPTFNPWFMRISDRSEDEAQAIKDEAKKHLIHETYEHYNRITRPHLELHRSDCEWMDNIWLHGQEKNKIIYKDDDEVKGFMIVQDSKWNGSSIEDMHYLAILKKKIVCLRDLNNTHLDLLESIETIGTFKIKEEHDLSDSDFKAYIHYPPSHNKFHIHFTSVDHKGNGEHPLSIVIYNIKNASDYYQRITLPFVVTTHNKLGNEYKKNGVI